MRLFAKLPYDALRHLEPVTPIFTGAMVLAAHPSLVALAKAGQPGKYFISVPSLGSPPHIFALLLTRGAGIDLTMVLHKSGAEALRSAMSGEIPLLMDGPVGLAPQIQAGKLKALAVTGSQREAVLPATPTARESGIDAQGEAWVGIVTSAGTPAAIVQLLNREMVAIMSSPEMRALVASRGLRAISSTPEAFRAQIKDDHAKWGALIREASLKLD